MHKYPKCTLEDVTNASIYVYRLKKCDTTLGDMKLGEHLQNDLGN
jgi:hypothetical protein